MDRMEFMTMDMLLFLLEIPYEAYERPEESEGISTVRLYAGETGFLDGALIVSRLSDTMSIWSKYPNCRFLCLRDRFPDEAEEGMDKRNVIVLRTNYSVEAIFNRVMDVCLRLHRWEADMEVSVLQNRGLQELADLSEGMIGNHIDIMDGTFKLLAYTKNIPIDDPVTNELIALGYHGRETVERFKALRRIEEFEQNDDVIVATDHEMCQYETVKRVFHKDGRIRMYVIMHCNRKRVEPGLLELFGQLLIFVGRYVRRPTVNSASFEASQNFLMELLEEKVQTMDEAVNRASYASVPFQKDYCLYVVAFQDHFNVPLENVAKTLAEQIPSSYVLSFRRRIVIVSYLEEGKSDREKKERMLCYLEQHLAGLPCTVGVSNVFDNLWQLTSALEQAGCAIEYGVHVEREPQGETRKDVVMYDFEQSFLTLVVAKSMNQSPGIFRNCFSVQAVRKIREYDRGHGTNLLGTLDVYLGSGKRATDVCRVLHMHRNTVLYQMERVETLLDVSLRDEEVCMKLRLGILMLKSHMQELVDASHG